MELGDVRVGVRVVVGAVVGRTVFPNEVVFGEGVNYVDLCGAVRTCVMREGGEGGPCGGRCLSVVLISFLAVAGAWILTWIRYDTA